MTIDYHRVFDLAVFAGRLSRGEPARIAEKTGERHTHDRAYVASMDAALARSLRGAR